VIPEGGAHAELAVRVVVVVVVAVVVVVDWVQGY